MLRLHDEVVFSYQDAKNALKWVDKNSSKPLKYGYRRLNVLFHIEPVGVDDKGTLYWHVVDHDREHDHYDLRYWQNTVARHLLKWYENMEQS